MKNQCTRDNLAAPTEGRIQLAPGQAPIKDDAGPAAVINPIAEGTELAATVDPQFPEGKNEVGSVIPPGGGSAPTAGGLTGPKLGADNAVLPPSGVSGGAGGGAGGGGFASTGGGSSARVGSTGEVDLQGLLGQFLPKKDGEREPATSSILDFKNRKPGGVGPGQGGDDGSVLGREAAFWPRIHTQMELALKKDRLLKK